MCANVSILVCKYAIFSFVKYSCGFFDSAIYQNEFSKDQRGEGAPDADPQVCTAQEAESVCMRVGAEARLLRDQASSTRKAERLRRRVMQSLL